MDRVDKMDRVVEDFTIGSEIKRQQELICCCLEKTERILSILRGANSLDEKDCVKEECLMDSLKINGSNLDYLERSLNEIIRKIMG